MTVPITCDVCDLIAVRYLPKTRQRFCAEHLAASTSPETAASSPTIDSDGLAGVAGTERHPRSAGTRREAKRA